jgi:DNA-binding IclR family transcriptional regulator/sugar lactone lactonase YvrE
MRLRNRSISALNSIMRINESALTRPSNKMYHNMDNLSKIGENATKAWRGEEEPGAGTVPGAALISKAFSLIDTIGAAPGLVTVPELLKATGWPRPTLYRILAAVTAHGFIRFDPVAQGYTLGYRFLELAQNVWAAPDLAAVASIELQRLRDMTGETAYLAVPHDGGMMALGKFEGVHTVRSAARLGVRKPMHCTSQGKAVLAFLPEAEADRLIGPNPLERFTQNTITDPRLLKAHLGIVRQRGYSVEDEEILVGNRCVGAPVLDATGRPVAAISVAGPIWRLTRERAEQLGPEIAMVARNIGLQLRGSGDPPAGGKDHPLVHPAAREPAFYGANPCWDAHHSVLHWVDRLGPLIHATGATTSHTFRPVTDAPIDAASLKDGEMIAILADRQLRIREGVCVADDPVMRKRQIGALATAPNGSLWAANNSEASSQIGPVTLTGEVESVWTVSARIDAMAWAPDGQKLYATDSSRGTIYVLHAETRTPRILNRIPRVSGEPRGLAVDAAGRLWVALYDGWSIARLSPEGEVERVTALPVPRPTGIAFGGDDGQSIFVTTARVGLTRDVLDNAPLSGRLLVIQPTPEQLETVPEKKRRRSRSKQRA